MVKRAEYLGPEKRRPLVLDAALEIFAEGGFADAAMSAIAQRAGVSKAVLYDCFPGGKQEIFYALLDRSGEHFMESVMEIVVQTNRMPLDEGLYSGLNAFLEYAEAHPLDFKILFGEAGTADPEIARRLGYSRNQIIAKMGERTREIMEAAGLPFVAVAEVYNHAIIAVAEEMARWHLTVPEIPRDDMVRAVVSWFMKGFEGIIPGETWRTGSKT